MNAQERIEQLKADLERARGIAVALEGQLARVNRIANAMLEVHSRVVMDTEDDRALHARAVHTFRAALNTEGDV